MTQDENFRFRLTISKEHYECKQDAQACLSSPGAKAINRARIAWMEHEVNISEFLQLATSGYCFCNLFGFDPTQQYKLESKDGKENWAYPVYKKGANKGYMKIQFKADRFFRGAQTIFVDVDYTRFNDVQDYLALLSLPPTCVYMSFSDKKEKGKAKIVSRRFRMVYVFSEILDAAEFEHISRNITNHIIADTGEPMEDDCGTRKSQYMNGVFGNDETYRSDYIYSKYDFGSEGKFYEVPVVEDIAATDEEVDEAPVFDARLVSDMERLDYQEFMHCYSQRLYYFYRVEKPDWIDGKYQFTEEGYLQLFYYRERVSDGEHRRRKLFQAACQRRLIWPEVDANTLLFNLYIDRERFYDNSDGVITITHLKRKVLKVLQMSMEEIAVYCGFAIEYWKKKRPRIIFRPGLGYSFGLMRWAYKEIRYREIDEQYDPTMSLRENIEAGLDIPQSTLYRYCNERGYKTSPDRKPSEREERHRARQQKIDTFLRLYNPHLTSTENMEAMRAEGLELSYRTYMRWKETYIAPQPSTNFEPIPLPEFNIFIDFDAHPFEKPTEQEKKEIFEENNWPDFWSRPLVKFNWPYLS